jgi:protein bicaudal D
MEGPHPISPLNLNNSNHHPIGDIQSLKEELARINAELVQASEERAQAAEYGLVILEEKQNLQIQFEELSGLYESTKRELENSTDVSEGLRIILLYKEGKRREEPTVGEGGGGEIGKREREKDGGRE